MDAVFRKTETQRAGRSSKGLCRELRVSVFGACELLYILRTPLISVRDQTADSYRYHLARR